MATVQVKKDTLEGAFTFQIFFQGKDRHPLAIRTLKYDLTLEEPLLAGNQTIISSPFRLILVEYGKAKKDCKLSNSQS